ncbi:tRNA-specific adenosine deaminase [Halobacteriales archaeon SW_8_65_20]|nr:MAG: tRNA-specific adenosine deaminase [Halobacteriales archaeon QH_7_65_31]PSQ31625.1 MAG: tRNA-specific adenosine deaminase [Halobacteriales archaeon SW_6_65_46]PSQ53432.1 MAG: tRNA-specific adenosine deaminase [Halobacteriales archaeon SW_8_65_20]
MPAAEQQFVDRTITLARENVTEGGRPFSCLVVRDGEILAESPNLVAQTNDPTAHAEIIAIRQACRRIASEDLSGCDVYVMAHPCPMCLGSLYYCSPDNVFFLTHREEYASHYTDERRYFEFGEFYDEYEKSWDDRELPLVHESNDDALAVYAEWERQNTG